MHTIKIQMLSKHGIRNNLVFHIEKNTLLNAVYEAGHSSKKKGLRTVQTPESACFPVIYLSIPFLIRVHFE